MLQFFKKFGLKPKPKLIEEYTFNLQRDQLIRKLRKSAT